MFVKVRHWDFGSLYHPKIYVADKKPHTQNTLVTQSKAPNVVSNTLLSAQQQTAVVTAFCLFTELLFVFTLPGQPQSLLPSD